VLTNQSLLSTQNVIFMSSSFSGSKGFNITLWVVQVLLAALFIMAGSTKLFQSMPALAAMMPWTQQTPEALVRFIGFSELLGGMGVILPSVFRIKPRLTVWAAIGLALVQVFAALFHLSRGESNAIGINLVLVSLAVLVAWGRNSKVPVLARA
jgi:uncharacterized membrane protein YphA (DoxX/SURF4 family)